ncbi:MAG: glycosyltransferase family 1 protein [Ignavibacteriae bacterium]|nr:MAG: glycosyltransferase family 1 protein [Ignavibacteriota bacterium]
MKKFKILHISPNGELYGTERHILSIVKYSDKRKFEHTVMLPCSGSFDDILQSIGIRTIIAGRPHGYKHKSGTIFSPGFWKLRREIKMEKPEIVHCHLNSYGLIAAKLAGVKTTVHTRHGVFWTEEELENLSFQTKTLQKIKSALFSSTVAIGEYERNTLINIFNYSPEKISFTYNGVTVDEIESKVDNTKKKMELFGTNDLIIGAVGRLEKQKGFHMLVESAKKVLSEVANVKFVILGDGSLRNYLQGLINEYDITDRFVLMPYKKNVYDYFRNLDIMVQTSLWEGISYVVLEAMALKRPVIALTSPNTSGVKEIIIQGKTGYLIEDNFINLLSEKIIELACNNEKSVRMGLEGYNHVKKKFTEQKTADDMDKVYCKLLSIE